MGIFTADEFDLLDQALAALLEKMADQVDQQKRAKIMMGDLGIPPQMQDMFFKSQYGDADTPKLAKKRIALLRAKLVQMEDTAEVEEFIEGSL